MRITKIKNPTALNTLFTMRPISAPLSLSPTSSSVSVTASLAPEDPRAGLLLLPGLGTQLASSHLVSSLHSHDLTPSSALWHTRLRSLNMQLMSSEQSSPCPRAWWHFLLNTRNPGNTICDICNIGDTTQTCSTLALTEPTEVTEHVLTTIWWPLTLLI